jgi:DNA-binding SARP family transcriptional activator
MLEKEPFQEAAHRIIIKAHLDSGERGRALEQYKRLESIMKQSFNIKPSQETQKLIDSIK